MIHQCYSTRKGPLFDAFGSSQAAQYNCKQENAERTIVRERSEEKGFEAKIGYCDYLFSINIQIGSEA